MTMQNPPCLFYFPLKIMVVDDDKNYLISCKNKIQFNQVELSDKPLDVMNQLVAIEIDIKSFIKEYVTNEFSVNYSTIASFVEKYNTSNEIGILITDYQMPEINGIDLCTKFERTNLIKILLTGEYQIDDAIEALNNKQIDYYLPKNLDGKLLTAINNLHIKFFNLATNNICQMLDVKNLPFLRDNDYIAIFDSIIKNNNITTYFALNNYGCYYMENTDNKFVLSIYNNEDLAELKDEYLTQSLPAEQVKSNKIIPSCRSLLTNNIEFLTCSQQGDYSYCLEKI